ncbi:MAG: hypothetical protein ACI8Y4_003380 [Candidatus Poriferisodalaceae bacterium]|jgi:hypothetical protein
METTDSLQLAKPHLDIGTMVSDWVATETFWTETVGIAYEKFEKIGGGVRQHRFAVHGSIVKVNHSRNQLATEPTIHRRVRIAHEDTTEPTLLRDPEGVEVELVPPGHEGVTGIEIVNATVDLAKARLFWGEGIGGAEIEPNRYRIGDTIVSCIHEPDLVSPTTRSAAGFRYLTVQVMNVDVEFARLVAMGFVGEVSPVSLGHTARISFVRDPDGGYLEVSQRAEVTGTPIPKG